MGAVWARDSWWTDTNVDSGRRAPGPRPGSGSAVVDAFFACAREHAHRPAIAGRDRQLRYDELARSVRELALRLGPDCGVVGVQVTRSEYTIVALLATLAAGGT